MARRDEILTAAVRVLAEEGMRGLTHRAVDAHAGLPQGSTSNVFRTRRSLVEGLTAHLAQEDVVRWGALLADDPGEDLIGLLERWIERSLGEDRHLTQARYAVFLAAADDPALAEALRRPRAGLEEWAAGLLTSAEDAGHAPDASGRAEPEPAGLAVGEVMTLLDGLILHALCLPRPDFDPGPTLRTLLATVTADRRSAAT